MCENELRTSRLSKVIVRQTDVGRIAVTAVTLRQWGQSQRYYRRDGNDTYSVTVGMGTAVCHNTAETCPYDNLKDRKIDEHSPQETPIMDLCSFAEFE